MKCPSILIPWILAAGLAACASSSETPTPSAPIEAAAVIVDLEELLPAGLYWGGYPTCAECPPPTAATVQVAASAASAERLVADAPAGLTPGYPVVVHGDELGLDSGEVVVIFGLHRSAGAAERLSAQLPGSRVLTPVSPRWGSDPNHFVARVSPGPPVAAWARDRVRSVQEALARAGRDSSPEAVRAALAQEEPLCRVDPARVFVVGHQEIDWYAWAPVRCGDVDAYVPWRESLLGQAAVMRRGHAYVLRRIHQVDCDQPTFEEHPYDPARRSSPHVLADDGGCGSP